MELKTITMESYDLKKKTEISWNSKEERERNL